MNQSKAGVIRVEFNGQEIEAIEKDGKVWVGLRKLCDNIGVSYRKQRDKIKRNPALEKGYDLMGTPSKGGEQESFCIDFDVLFFWLSSISASKVKEEVRETLIVYQKECVKVLRDHFMGAKPEARKIEPPKQVMTQAQMMLAQAQIMVKFEANQQELISNQKEDRAEIVAIGSRLAESEEREGKRDQQRQALLQLPGPTNQVASRTTRSLLNERMRSIGIQTGDYRGIWKKLYTEYKYRYSIDLQARAKKKNMKAIDVAEDLEVIGVLYDLCCHLWP